MFNTIIESLVAELYIETQNNNLVWTVPEPDIYEARKDSYKIIIKKVYTDFSDTDIIYLEIHQNDNKRDPVFSIRVDVIPFNERTSLAQKVVDLEFLIFNKVY